MPMNIAMLENLGLPEVMLWLLTFAIVYGVLSKINIMKREASAIVAIVIGFFVLFATPVSMIAVLSQMSSSLILVVLGILVLLVFLEAAGIKHKEYITDPKTGKIIEEIETSLFTKHKEIAAVTFIIISILIFIGAGGMNLLGWNLNLTGTSSMSLLFFVVIILAVLWLIRGKDA